MNKMKIYGKYQASTEDEGLSWFPTIWYDDKVLIFEFGDNDDEITLFKVNNNYFSPFKSESLNMKPTIMEIIKAVKKIDKNIPVVAIIFCIQNIPLDIRNT